MVAVLAVVACGGCLSTSGSGGGSDGGAAGGGGASCPVLGSTAWEITEHCEPTFVGMTSTVTQSGCTYVTRLGDYDCDGTIGPGGEVAHSCTGPDPQQITCSGYVVGGTMDLDCDSCVVKLVAR